MYENYPTSAVQGSMAAGQMALANCAQVMNPTLRENIDAKIQFHKDEICRLEAIKEKVSSLLDVNLRDLHEAMRF